MMAHDHGRSFVYALAQPWRTPCRRLLQFSDDPPFEDHGTECPLDSGKNSFGRSPRFGLTW